MAQYYSNRPWDFRAFSQQSNEFFRNLPYDILAIGNHELYIRNNTLNMHGNFAPHFNGRYLSSNVNITIDGVSKPLGSRFAIFKMRKGRAVTALDVLFDFTGNDVHTTVQTVENMVKEAWFADAIKDERDVFLLQATCPCQTSLSPTLALCGFDIYAGPFTKNDQLTVSPFVDSFFHISNVPFSVATAVLPAHNGAGADTRNATRWLRRSCGARGIRDPHACAASATTPARAARVPRFPGLHRICRTYRDFADDALIDLVFVDFIETQLIGIPSGLQSENVYTTADVAKYTSVPASEALGIYAEQVWN
ncbi:hypothetical protein B0H14DRAFT_3752451 [Mycena olivaceomarginata]|nr:hypothetical protein B0H14DRAFT_3752451 [Mycena olivaceomarginata]